MVTKRHSERALTRKPGAGRPRKHGRAASGPVDSDIVRAAARLFANQGVGTTTMGQIADEVGLAISSVYYYFASKHAILERIVAEVNAVPLGLVDAACDRFDDAPRRLYAFIQADAEAVCNFPFDINEVHRLAADEPEMFTSYWSERDELLERVEAIICAGVADASLLPVDPRLAALTVLANDEAIRNWHQFAVGTGSAPGLNRTIDADEIGSFMADLVVRGLLTDPAEIGDIRDAVLEES